MFMFQLVSLTYRPNLDEYIVVFKEDVIKIV